MAQSTEALTASPELSRDNSVENTTATEDEEKTNENHIAANHSEKDDKLEIEYASGARLALITLGVCLGLFVVRMLSATPLAVSLIYCLGRLRHFHCL
jgi:hypothetical protein